MDHAQQQNQSEAAAGGLSGHWQVVGEKMSSIATLAFAGFYLSLFVIFLFMRM